MIQSRTGLSVISNRQGLQAPQPKGPSGGEPPRNAWCTRVRSAQVADQYPPRLPGGVQKLVVAEVNSHVIGRLAASGEKDEIANLQAVLLHLFAHLVLLARRSGQADVELPANESTDQRGDLVRHHQSCEGSQTGEHKALGQQLPDDPAPTGTEREPDAHLFLPCDRERARRLSGRRDAWVPRPLRCACEKMSSA